jgi:transcriptional regulator with XRE-family HTH domain
MSKGMVNRMNETRENANLVGKMVGVRCRKLRLAAGLTQVAVSEHGAFSLSHYQKLERGVLDPQLTTLLRLAEVFGVQPRELVEDL